MSKLVIPHIHKTLGGAGFFSKISETGEVEDIKVNVLEGLRQIEGILIGRRVFEAPLVISRICGICPVSHILNACRALEIALDVKISPQTERLRRLITSAQLIQSHSAHIFFMSLTDFFDIKGEENLIKKFSKETSAVLDLRDFGLRVIETVGGRTVHPMTLRVGGFTKVPEKGDLKKILVNYDKAYKAALMLVKLFETLEYPQLKRETLYASSYEENSYPYSQGQKIKIGDEILTRGDFFSNKIEESLKSFPVKKVLYKKEPYMVGALARLKNNRNNLDKESQGFVNSFWKKQGIGEKEFFTNNFYNIYAQAVEILYLVKQVKKDISALEKEELKPAFVECKEKKGSGLALLEAPRGILMSYLEVGRDGRIADCSIITPTAQYLNNLEADLVVMIPQIYKLSKEKKIKRIKTLIRAYDPCIACAVH